MNISEMHVWFRQYAQQMGMQNTRAILPEQIDLLINTSIIDITNQLITQSVGTTNDRVITDNSKIGQINALRSLYKVHTGFSTTDWATHTDMPFNYWTLSADALKAIKYLYLVDGSIRYSHKSTSMKTNWFPIRLIDDMYLADTLNDFILKPRLRTPIAVSHDGTIELYVDTATNMANLQIDSIRLSYIAKPATVVYKSDLGGTDVDCDLPEYLHVDILKHAVDLYRISVSGALSNAQQQAQQQQQETARNNYRNDAQQ